MSETCPGGHLARSAETGGLLLRESAQCPEEDEARFADVNRHRFFNTNNLWIDLEALKRAFTRIEAHAYIKLKLKEYSNTGREVPPNLINNYSKSIQPAARFDASGRLEVSRGFLNTAKQVGYYTSRRRHTANLQSKDCMRLYAVVEACSMLHYS